MYPILFSIGRVNIYTHGLLIVIGALLGGLIIYFLAKKQEIRATLTFDLIIFSLIGGLIGARILFVILYYDQFSNFKEIFYIWYGGLVSYGGIAGGLLVAWWFLLIKKEKVLKWFDIGIIGLMTGWAFGRIGCLLAGDSLGILSNLKLAIWGRIPTQLFESIWAIFVAVICWLILKLKIRWQLKDGLIFVTGIGLYALGRLIIDFWRDETIFFWFLKTGQFGSIIIFLIALIIVGLFLIKKIRRPNGSY